MAFVILYQTEIMDYKQIGNTELKTAPIVFGGNVFGWTVNENDSFKLLDKILETGINMIDTADSYSHWAPGNSGGESETIIGKWMKERGNRDKLTIATKVGSNPRKEGRDISKKYIIKAAEESLRRLQTDHIDLYFTHWDDDKTPVEETLEAYQTLIDQGKVRYIGASNISNDRLKASLEVAKNSNLPKYEVSQPEYSLMQRDKFEGELKEICTNNNMGVTSYFSLASGFLTGKYSSVDDIKGKEREKFLKDYFNKKGKNVLKAVKDISDHHNITQAAVALRWIIQRPGITAPIASATKPEHLKSFQEALKTELNPEEMDILNNVSA